MRTLFLALALLTLCPYAVRAQSAESFRYVDEDGEEIFGPDYMPTSVGERGFPLFIGQPSGGRAIPPELLIVPQDALLPMIEMLSLPNEEDLRLPPNIPFLQSLQTQMNNLRNEAVPNSASAASVAPAVPAGASPPMRVHYVFVGQGAGAIVELPCGTAVIDLGGEYGGGEGKVDGGELFGEYLDAFFDARPALNRTIDLLVFSHPHADHINGESHLTGASPAIKVANYVDNGQTGSSGTLLKQTLFRDWAEGQGANYSPVELVHQTLATGATNAAIDPFSCADITAFWGGANERISTGGGYTNPNNHSVLIKVDYGEASFMFLGDLMDDAANDMLDEFADNLGVFDVDVFQLSHHGADGDTTDRLLEALTPQIAVISMGTNESTAPSTAWDHGHPRRNVIDILQDLPSIVSDVRTPSQTFWAFPAQETDSTEVEIKKAIYGTGWEGHVIIEATKQGDYTVETSGFED